MRVAARYLAVVDVVRLLLGAHRVDVGRGDVGALRAQRLDHLASVDGCGQGDCRWQLDARSSVGLLVAARRRQLGHALGEDLLLVLAVDGELDGVADLQLVEVDVQRAEMEEDVARDNRRRRFVRSGRRRRREQADLDEAVVLLEHGDEAAVASLLDEAHIDGELCVRLQVLDQIELDLVAHAQHGHGWHK